MKKWHSIIGIFLIGLTAGCGDQPPATLADNDWTVSNLKGSVKEIKEITYKARKEGEEWVKGDPAQTYSLKEFDENGFVTYQKYLYSDDDSPYYVYQYLYDDEGNITRINSVDPEGNTLSFYQVEEREGKVRILKYINFYGIGELRVMADSTKIVWDGFRMKETNVFDHTGRLMSSNTYTYDENNDVKDLLFKNYTDTTDYTKSQDIAVVISYLDHDKRGNWTRQLKEYLGYHNTEIIERTYTYH